METENSMQKRPPSINVFGILNIVFAGWGAVGLLGSAVMLFASHDFNNPVIKIMHDNPGYATWVKISFLLGIPSCAVLAAAGIGLLFLKPWARILSIVYAVYAIFFGIVGTAFNAIFLLLPMLHQAREQNGPAAAGAIAGAIGGLLGGCLGVIYPVLLLIFMTRPKIAAAFRPGVQATPTPWQ
jgi:hypothetical protein